MVAYAATGSIPSATSRGVRAWLIVVAAMVLVMVGVGGATRLTGSGLSITEWQPIMGAVPPLNEAEWQEAFEKYKRIPQYEQVNKGMSLGEFKAIFYWEWGHRLLGRLIGIVFALPLLWFWWRGEIGPDLKARLGGLLALGGLQGAMGWYMVKSGLVDRVSVSQYRLAAHLGLAILIFGALVWIVLEIDRHRAREARLDTLSRGQVRLGCLIAVLVFVQILLGALVAGLKAGLTYNTWPLMDGRIVPDGVLMLSPWWLNIFENIPTVQFDHRMMAYLVIVLAGWHAWAVNRSADDERVRRSSAALVLALLAQAALGIWALIAVVPLSLGIAHQAGAVAVFGVAVWHVHRLVKR